MLNKQKILFIIPLILITFTLLWPHIATNFKGLDEIITDPILSTVYGVYIAYAVLVALALNGNIKNKWIVYTLMGLGIVVALLAILFILALLQLGNVWRY